MGRANPFRALLAGLDADEFLLLRKAVDEVGAWRDGSTAVSVPW